MSRTKVRMKADVRPKYGLVNNLNLLFQFCNATVLHLVNKMLSIINRHRFLTSLNSPSAVLNLCLTMKKQPKITFPFPQTFLWCKSHKHLEITLVVALCLYSTVLMTISFIFLKLFCCICLNRHYPFLYGLNMFLIPNTALVQFYYRLSLSY